MRQSLLPHQSAGWFFSPLEKNQPALFISASLVDQAENLSYKISAFIYDFPTTNDTGLLPQSVAYFI
jgi:hypothetical protein